MEVFFSTSPPYWTLKKYEENEGQLGEIEDYEAFLDELDKVWRECAMSVGARWTTSVASLVTFAFRAGKAGIL